jgi:peptidyl-prolyl cis-trans isomerase D
MITWMQRHKKWLIITIWISTIAFIGAGFVGWGQYSYGSKAGAIAKVGDIEITQGELQKAYSNLYMQYNQMLQGNFDEEQAEALGLKRQAFQQLKQQALLLNLAKSYDLIITDIELFNFIKSQNIFHNKQGTFDKEIYKRLLSQNRLTPKEYEESLRKDLLIQKTLTLLPVKVSKNEAKITNTLFGIADKIEYKVLSQDMVKVNVNDNTLKAFWEKIKNNFMTEIAYKILLVKQEPVTKEYAQKDIEEYYNQNKIHFRDNEGKILPLENAKDAVVAEMNDNATKKAAKYTYLKMKKSELPNDIQKNELTLSATNNPLNEEALNKIASLTPDKPYAKPIKVNNSYYIIKLLEIVPAKVMSFEAAKEQVKPLYIAEEKKKKLLKLAQESVVHFQGEVSDFITLRAQKTFVGLQKNESSEFVQKLFSQHKKRAFITLTSGKIVLFNILEQKLLTNKNSKEGDTVMQKIKSSIFSGGLIKELLSKYKTETYVQGL